MAEEAREARRTQVLANATRMQDIVGGLEHLARTFHAREARSNRSSFTLPVSSTASVIDEDETKVDRDLASFVLKPILAEEGEKHMEIIRPPVFSPPLPFPSSSSKLGPGLLSVPPEAGASVVLGPSREEHEHVDKGKEKAHNSLVDRGTSPITDAARRLFDSTFRAATRASATATPADGDSSSLDFYARTASALLTGFFLGTFITLCVLSPHRREIANHFT